MKQAFYSLSNRLYRKNHFARKPRQSNLNAAFNDCLLCCYNHMFGALAELERNLTMTGLSAAQARPKLLNADKQQLVAQGYQAKKISEKNL